MGLMNEVCRVLIVDVVGYVDALVERVPTGCGLDGGGGVVVVAVCVVVEDMVLFFFSLLGGQDRGQLFSNTNIWAGAWCVFASRFLVWVTQDRGQADCGPVRY